MAWIKPGPLNANKRYARAVGGVNGKPAAAETAEQPRVALAAGATAEIAGRAARHAVFQHAEAARPGRPHG